MDRHVQKVRKMCHRLIIGVPQTKKFNTSFSKTINRLTLMLWQQRPMSSIVLFVANVWGITDYLVSENGVPNILVCESRCYYSRFSSMPGPLFSFFNPVFTPVYVRHRHINLAILPSTVGKYFKPHNNFEIKQQVENMQGKNCAIMLSPNYMIQYDYICKMMMRVWLTKGSVKSSKAINQFCWRSSAACARLGEMLLYTTRVLTKYRYI